MDTGITPSPRKARKRVIGRGNAVPTPDINRTVLNRTGSSVGISENSTLPLTQPSCSRDGDISDSDIQFFKTRNSMTNSQNTTVPFSQPGCSRDPDSSDSDISPAPTQKILRRTAPIPASNTSKKIAASEASPHGTVNKRNVAGTPLINPNNLVSQCVFYILGANGSKKPIKKRDIIQHVFEGRNSQAFPEIIIKAASILQKTFGFELMELKSSKNEYLLVNKLCHQYGVQAFAKYSHMDRQMQGFIFYILTLIFMNENSIMEDELWKALDPLGVEIKSRKPHPIFGDVQKLVTSTLVKQMYLERRQLSKDPPEYELSWGERAHKEVLKEDLLDFVCKIMPDTTPKEWILQYKDAKGKSPDGDAETEME